MKSYKTTWTMSAIWQIWHYLLCKDESVNKWHFILTNSLSVMLLHQQDNNINQLQSMLQELSISD